MTKKIFLLITITFFLSSCEKKTGSYSGTINSFKRYPYENFHASYEMSGDARGSEEVYVSGYGKYETQISKTEMFSKQGITPEDHTMITRIADIYTLDNYRKTYTHTHLTSLDSLFHLDPTDIPSPEGYTEMEMKNNFMRKDGQDSVSGKLATRWQLVDGDLTMWTWNGILVRKFAGTPENNITMTMKNFDAAWVVDTTKFSIPSDYKETTGKE